jgi:GNAT superfamily N-acetyltransferase
LQELGFQPVGVMPAMAVEIAEVQEIPLAPGYDCRPVESNDLTDWLAAFAVGYELPLGTARLFCPAPETPDGIEEANCQCFLIRKGDQPVATSMVFEAEGLAGIYCVATAPSERGKGLGAVATVAALRAAEMRGYRVGILQSTVMGHSVYRRLGFRDFGGIPMYLKIPGPASS